MIPGLLRFWVSRQQIFQREIVSSETLIFSFCLLSSFRHCLVRIAPVRRRWTLLAHQTHRQVKKMCC